MKRFKTPQRMMTEPKQQRPVAVRLLLLSLIWWTARLPVAVPDFHEIDHHHAVDQSCMYHQHLNRWHESETSRTATYKSVHDPVLHFHWLLPGLVLPDGESVQNQKDSGSSDIPLGTDLFVDQMTAMPCHDNSDLFAAFMNAQDSSQAGFVTLGNYHISLLKHMVWSQSFLDALCGFIRTKSFMCSVESGLIPGNVGLISNSFLGKNIPLRC